MVRAERTPKSENAPGRTEKTRTQRVRRIALEVGFVVLAFFLLTHWQTRSLLSGGEPAPGFELADLDGNVVKLSDLNGKTTLVHFWATWCGVCRREFGTLNALYDGLADDEALVTIVDSTDQTEVKAFAREHGLRYPVLLGTPAVMRTYRVQAFPTNYFVDSGGILRGATVGMSTRLGMAARMHCAR